MLMPSIFGENLIDEFFVNPFKEYREASSLMRTDVKEHDQGYELDISMPGFQKEDIHAELKEGNLIISATSTHENEEKDENTGRYIRRERYSGSCSRSFFVGEDIKQEDIRAKYENGVLSLFIPKKEPRKPEIEENKYIAIEG